MIHETLRDKAERMRRYNYPGGAATVTITLEEYRDLLLASYQLDTALDRLDDSGKKTGEIAYSLLNTAPAAPRARVLTLAEAGDAPIVWLHSQSGFTEPGRVDIMTSGIKLQRFGKKDFLLNRSDWGRDIVAFDICPSDEDVAAIQWLRPGQEAQDD